MNMVRERTTVIYLHVFEGSTWEVRGYSGNWSTYTAEKHAPLITHLPGTHAWVAHARASVVSGSPTQSFPPFAGAGLSQVLVCFTVSVPPPHVALH